MQIYIALLRGINVGGQKKINMSDLRSHLQALNFKNVQTYIQSGNVLFEYKTTESEKLEKQMAQKIEREYGFKVSVLIRTPQELSEILINNPFLKDSDKTPDRTYFTLLAEEPSVEQIEELKAINYHPEEYAIRGRTVYFFTPNGYGKAKMNNNFFEQKLKVTATTRNWKTLHQLVTMADIQKG